MVSMLKISLSRQKGQPEAPDPLFERSRSSRWIGRMDVLIEGSVIPSPILELPKEAVVGDFL